MVTRECTARDQDSAGWCTTAKLRNTSRGCGVTVACCSCMSKAAHVLTRLAQQLQNRPGIVTPIHSAGGLRCSAIASRMLRTDGSSDRTEVGQPAEEDQRTGEHPEPVISPPPVPWPTPSLPLGLASGFAIRILGVFVSFRTVEARHMAERRDADSKAASAKVHRQVRWTAHTSCRVPACNDNKASPHQ